MQEHNEENEEQETSKVSRWIGDLGHHTVLISVLTLLSGAAAYVIKIFFADWPLTKWVTDPLVVAGTVLLILASTSYIGRFLGILTRRFSKVARGSGLEEFLPLTPPKRAKKDWAICASRIKDEKPDRLRLLVFTGASTFAKPDTPLYEALRKYENDLQILIALPDSDAFQRVIEKISDNPGDKDGLRKRYREQHHAAREFCRTLAQRVPGRMRSIEVRGYNGPVIWKMVSFHNYLWLQHYCHPRSVEKTPAYIFRRRSATSLVVPLEYAFDTYWNSATPLLKRASDDKESAKDWDQGMLGPDLT